MKKNILIIEDDEKFLIPYAQEIERLGHRFTYAMDQDSAVNEIGNGKWDIIVLDACLNNDSIPDTRHLVGLIQKSCPGKPIVANSSSSVLAVELVKLGCTHKTCGKTSNDLLQVLIPLLA